MPFYDTYEQWRNKMYGGPKYSPDAYLGESLNDMEKSMVQEILPDHYKANLKSLGSVFVPEENRYVQKFELELNPEDRGSWRRSNMVIGGAVDQLCFSDPLVQAYAQVAYNRANMQLASWRQGPVLPEVTNALEKYPNVDPVGKYCDEDMRLAQRLEDLKQAAQSAEPQRKAALNQAFEMLSDPSGELGFTVGQAKRVFASVRETRRAAKVCPNEQVSGLLQQGAAELEKTAPAVRKLDDFYTALEHIAGLRQDPPTPEVLESARQFRLDTALLTTPAVPATAKTVAVELPNLENIILQGSFVHPANWNKTPARVSEMLNDAPKADGYVKKYASNIGSYTVDKIFGTDRQNIASANHMDRAGLIVIDGKTVEERMKEEHSRSLGLPPYDQWFAQKSREKTAEYVAAALMGGRRVEVYKPQADGKLPSDPIRLTSTGYAPAPEKPVLLNAWERFWNQFGFYKDKAAQAKADQESLEAKKRVLANHTVERMKLSMDKDNLTNMFFRDALQEQGFESVDEFGSTLSGNGGRLNYTRTALQSLCIGIMASQEVPMEDIMDPTKMQQEKQQVGKMVMERLAYNPQTGREGIITQVYDRTINTRTGDGEWLGKMMFAGEQSLMRQVNKMMHGVDMNDDAQMQKVLPALNLASSALYDMRQEVEKGMRHQNGWVTETMQSFSDQVGSNAPAEQRVDIARAYNDKVTLVSNAGTGIAREFIARYQIEQEGHNARTMSEALGQIVMGEAMKKSMMSNQGRCFTDKVPSEHQYAVFNNGITELKAGGGALGKLTEAALNDPKARKHLGAMAKDGKLGPAMDVKVVPGPEGFDTLSMTPADKLLKTAAKTAPQMGKR